MQEDPTCQGAAKPTYHNYWACALEPWNHNCCAHVLQLVMLAHLEPVLHKKRSHHYEQPTLQPESSPSVLQLEKVCLATKTKINKRVKLVFKNWTGEGTGGRHRPGRGCLGTRLLPYEVCVTGQEEEMGSHFWEPTACHQTTHVQSWLHWGFSNWYYLSLLFPLFCKYVQRCLQRESEQTFLIMWSPSSVPALKKRRVQLIPLRC